ncbi:TonB family protein [Verrucomicrobiota bacterium]
MHTRPAIAGQLARYAGAILISAGIHWGLFRSAWSHRPTDESARIRLLQGIHAVELTLLPSVASKATEPQPVEPAPAPEPIQEAPQQQEAEIAVPEPEKEKREDEAPVEPEAEPTAQQIIDSIEQTGSLQSKGVSAQAVGEIVPLYPRRSNLRGEEGTVILNVHISEEGKVVEATITKSSGFRRLDAAALKAVRKTEFTPAMENGHPVEDVIPINITFELN